MSKQSNNHKTWRTKMITHLQDTITLNNGLQMPGMGLGFFK